MLPFYTAAPTRVLEKSQAAGGPVAGRGSVADGVSRGQELARRDAAEGAELRVHVRLVVVLRVERHVRQPRPVPRSAAGRALDGSARCGRTASARGRPGRGTRPPAASSRAPSARAAPRSGSCRRSRRAARPPRRRPRPCPASARSICRSTARRCGSGSRSRSPPRSAPEARGFRADEVGEVQREAGRLAQWPRDDGVGAGRTQPHADDVLVRGLLEQHGPHLRTADPGAPADLRARALDESVGVTEVEDQLDAAVREDALAAMRAGAVVRPEMVDSPLQLRRPPRAVAPAAERRDAAYRLDRKRSNATR